MERIKKFLFSNTSTRQTIIKNTFWLGISTTLSKIIRSIVIIYAARLLGADSYGIFTYTLSLAAIFSIFSDIGLSGLLTRELSKAKDFKFASTTFVIKIALIIIAFLLMIVIGPDITKFEEAKQLIFIVAILIAFDSLRSFIYSVARAQNNMQTEAGLEIITEVFITLACVYMLFTSPSATSLAIGYAIGGGAGLLISILTLKKYFSGIYRNFERTRVPKIINSAAPFALMGVFGVLMTNIDSVIIGIFGDTKALGQYAAAQRPISLLYLIPGFLYASLFPIMSKLAGNDEKKNMHLLIQKSITFSMGIAMPLVLGGIILAYPLINVVFGSEFTGGVSTFQILLLTLLPIFPGMILSNVIFAENKQKIFIKSSLSGAIINVTLDLILIPILGIVGSAIATVIAQIVTNGIIFREVKKDYQINIYSNIKKMLLATLAMTALVLILKSLMAPLIVIVPLSIIAYISILILLKEELIKDIKDSIRI